MRGQLSKQELNKALNNHLYGSDISFLSKSDEDYALDALADAFQDDPLFSWFAGLEGEDPERDQKMYKLGRILNAHVNHRFFSGSRGVALGVRTTESKGSEDVQAWQNPDAHVNHRFFSGSRGVALGVRTTESLVGCMTLAPSSCARERTVDHIIAMIKYGAPPMYKSKEKSKYGPYSQKRMEKLNVLLKKKRKKNMEATNRWIYPQSIGVRPDQHGKGYGKKMLQLLTQTANTLSASIYLETDSENNESFYKHFGFHTVEKVNLSEQQWKGYGKKMLQLLTQTANSLNASIYLETESENNESMYKHFGFHTVEKLNLCVSGDDSPTANFTMYLMRKDPSE
eukprot:CAMPEP_0201988458 /NCGR_PEP_ID=MMETSP0904-20121228/92328_1 /ASSEMBLY_ACC=CAM_ASM_000553 /TAXON_ID=420261 /ORGANISM="Thalassiosira antarctica, Strain CCMP982" /LENGTH=340 /DNA_ID=CAMNT_0048542631 /DNA_START=107 /DNA_END=1130 /DNA_ORIENTATION=-